MEVMDQLLLDDPTVTVVVAGRATPEMEIWHASKTPGLRKRIRIMGMMNREELAALLRDSQIFYSPSAYESFGIAAAEALCSGCSVVAGRLVTMPSFEWFASEKSGQLTDLDNTAGHVESLLAELDAWQNGERDAAEISQIWSQRLHADKVAETVVGMMDRGC